MFEIEDYPYPENDPRGRRGKYKAALEALRVGQCINVGTDRKSLDAVVNALRNHLKRRGIENVVVRQVARCPDGVGRVWLLPKE